MNERFLRRLFRHVLLASVPVAATFACGGATADGPTGGEAGAGGTAGAGGSAGAAGRQGGAGGAADAGGVGGNGGGLGGGGPCAEFLWSPCTRCVVLDGGAIALDGGAIADCNSICGGPTLSCSPLPRVGTPVAVSCSLVGSCSLVTGRRPAGLAASNETEARHPGAYFAEVALLEAASVEAFRVLRDELLYHGAPLSLVRAAERAARDEVRHARITGALARRCGSNPRSPEVEKQPIRSLREIALENATEGCVRETYGALLATHQARAAKSKLVRSVFARIAEDETRHAALAWKVAAWLDGKLDDETRARVREARRQAAVDLAASVRIEPPSWGEDLGLPNAEISSRMAEQMTAGLWA